MFFFNRVSRYAKHNRRLKRLLVFMLVSTGLLFLSKTGYVLLQFPVVQNVPRESTVDIKHDMESVESVPQAHGPSQTAVLVMSATREAALRNHLEQLLKFRPSYPHIPIIISQDGTTESVSRLAASYVNSTANIFFIHHKDRVGVGSPGQKAAKNYFYIAQHYKWALDRVFFEMGYTTVIITEDDLDISEDFFSYFAATKHLLFDDISLWCISAWNDNGAASVTDRSKSDLLYRTDFFPGLGWMLTASVWKELSANWPEAYWDDWLRRPEVRKGRACIRPEVSRTAHNMKVAGKGSSNGLFKTFLSSIHLPDSPVDFSKVNVDSLKKKEYDVSLAAIVKNAEPLTFELLDGTLDATKTYKTIYKNPREFRAIAKKYKLMSDIRSGMARTAYYGIVPFMKDGSRVYAVHGNFDEKLLLNGTSSSYLYTADWDRMSRYLEFEELYCRPGKWTGKCDPADPGMTEWFKKRNRMRLLKILPQFMSARVQINVNTASKVCDFLRDNENILRIHIGESLGAVSTVHSTHTTTTIDFETAQLNIVRTSDQGGFEHYDFEWSKLGRIRYLKDTINLNEASWYGGPQTNNMQWPLPKSSHEFAPFITGDLFESSLNCYEPYWLSSNLVAVHVSDECVPLWTQHKEGYLNLQSLPYEAPFRNFQHKSLVFDYPKMTPTKLVIEKPIWTTWARYKETVNERSLLDFVGEVEAHGFEISQLELDDKWSTEYGEFEFDQHKFPNIPKVAELLKSKNIEFTLWIHPFVALSSKTAKNRNLHEIFVKTSDGKLGITRWWHGDSYILDITHPKACEWLSSELDSLRKLGVQRFKFDAGEVDYLPKDFLLNQGFTPNDFSKAFVTFASSYAAEVRTAWRTQKQGVLVRTMDRLSSWKDCGIETVLPILFNLAICGYHFNLPDMIGGNAYDGTHCDKELFIRWVQLNTFLFAMQFSISPWDYDEETVEICQKMMTKRRKYLHYLIKTFESATRGEVPIRPLWWVVESKEAFECDNQFFVGDDLMVAPVIRQHQRTRKVILPDGDWLGHDGVRCSGGTTVKVEAPLHDLPYFWRLKESE
ncbi:hypothetical protein QR680_001399 [Steinernema hermaphroditum]|uniref:Uncharacterized protein n=1 Tax=Steinernema hermaphroditum TaxID=289476 RepID=A0AA39GY68_9BILA|nr:hypothetical protein QR680_001399 [Steinernema hermaphroditum]